MHNCIPFIVVVETFICCFRNFFRLRLADILVRPMQRLTKYKILMEAIRKHISEESEAEIMDNMVSSEVLSVDRILCGNKKFISTFLFLSIIHAENLIAFMACFLY
jgi:RhoGEF domain